jgi:hypothetical protein
MGPFAPLISRLSTLASDGLRARNVDRARHGVAPVVREG